jgi:hypothetical protein
MEYVLEETVPAGELQKFESCYVEELNGSSDKASSGAQFEYAWCFVRLRYQEGNRAA